MTIIEDIAIEFGLSAREAAKLAFTAPIRYKTFEIDKRHGGKRLIAQPAREIKALQRFLISNRLSSFPVHDIATAYVTGRGIADNARVHLQTDYILKLDFKEFFPSIKPYDLVFANRRAPGHPIEKADLPYFVRLLFWGKGTIEPECLSIGAPSSPLLSNIIMHSLDTAMAELAVALRLNVSRYADDITVSGDSHAKIMKFEASLIRLIERTKAPSLEFNDRKRGFYTRGERRMVTGLILTPDGNISMGRERKRLISSLIHKVSLSALDEAQMMYAKGLLGFAIAVEPTFVTSLRRKYSDQVVDEVLRTEASDAVALRQALDGL